MCNFISGLYKQPALELTFHDLTSHANTWEALGLQESQGWREMHYLEDGTIECRTLAGDPVPSKTAEKLIGNQWPTFESFLEMVMTRRGFEQDIDCLVWFARNGRLPPGFTRWDMADKWGLTVAHAAASYGNLPPGFDRWGLADKTGRTVAQVRADSNN